MTKSMTNKDLNKLLEEKHLTLNKIKGQCYVISNNVGDYIGDVKCTLGNSGDKIWRFLN